MHEGRTTEGEGKERVKSGGERNTTVLTQKPSVLLP